MVLVGDSNHISRKERAGENVDLLLDGAGDLVVRDEEKAEASSPWSLLVELPSRNPIGVRNLPGS